MNKFTLVYPCGLSISYKTDTYQDFLQALIATDAVGKNVLKWLVSHKDLRVDQRYTYWNNGSSAHLIKEKV